MAMPLYERHPEAKGTITGWLTRCNISYKVHREAPVGTPSCVCAVGVAAGRGSGSRSRSSADSDSRSGSGLRIRRWQEGNAQTESADLEPTHARESARRERFGIGVSG